MKQKKKNIVTMDVSNTHIKTLLGSFNEPINESTPFFELQGTVTKTKGISKKGTINDRKKFLQSVNKALDSIITFSGYEIDEVVLSYTHPNIQFFKKTIGLQKIKNKKGIYITEKWLKTQKEKIQERIQKAHKHKKCTHFTIVSLIVDGEEVTYDPYEFTATKSLYMTYTYLLTPATFTETLLESIEHFVTVRTLHPVAITNGALLSDEQKEQGVILCDIGSEFTNITAYKNGSIEGIHIIPFGGNTITAEIALLKKIPPEEAEQIKITVQNEESVLKKRDLQSIDKKIGLALKKELLPCINQMDPEKKFTSGIMLIGRGSLYPNIEKITEKTIGLYAFQSKIPYHVQSHQHMHQAAWHTAYATLHGAATQQKNTALYAQKTSFLQKIMEYIHAVAKMFR